MANKPKATIKVKKKSWIQILAPKIFNEQLLGEVPVMEASSVLGRHITVNLMAITKDMRKQNNNIQFEISELKGSRAYTKMVGLNIMPAAVKRLVRRSKAKVEESFVVETKDGIYVRLKPLLVTNTATHRSVLTTLRSKVKEIVALECKKIDYNQLAIDIISGKMQKTIKDRLKKVYPIRLSEIRGMKIVSPDKVKYVNVITAKPVKEPAKTEAAKNEEQEAPSMEQSQEQEAGEAKEQQL